MPTARHTTLRQMLDELRHEGSDFDRELLGGPWTAEQEHNLTFLKPPLEPPYFWNSLEAGRLIISPLNDNFFMFFNIFLMAMNEREAHLAHWGRTSQGDGAQVVFLLRRICNKGRQLGIDVPIWLGEFRLFNMVAAALSKRKGHDSVPVDDLLRSTTPLQ